jgi:uncharacterized protein
MAETETEAQVAVEAPAAQKADPTAHIADPGPLGLAAFAMTTFVLSVFNAGLVQNAALQAVVLPLALFYGGLSQFVAGMWEFRKGNTFGALGFTSYGAFWLAFAAYVKYIAPSLGQDASTATGLFLLGWTIFTAYMTVAAARINAALLAVFVFLTLTFLFLTLGEFSGAAGVAKLGGYLGLVTAVLAWYTSFAGVANSTWKKTLLPVFPLAPSGR